MRLSTGTGHTSALFARKSQSILDNVIAGFSPRDHQVIQRRHDRPQTARRAQIAFPLLAQSGHSEERNRCRYRVAYCGAHVRF